MKWHQDMVNCYEIVLLRPPNGNSTVKGWSSNETYLVMLMPNPKRV